MAYFLLLVGVPGKTPNTSSIVSRNAVQSRLKHGTILTKRGTDKRRRQGKIMFDMAIHNKLKVLIYEKEIRDSRKLSYRIIAQEADIPLSVLTDYTSQKAKRFDSTTLEKLCKYFECQPGDLLVYSEEPPIQKQKAAR